jgi:glutamate dehydrogenase (NADP+)
MHGAEGIDFDRLIAAKQAGGLASLAGSDGIVSIAPQDIVGVDCDVLVPAALENLIHTDNAASIKARVVVELANGPITPEADGILQDKGIAVLPDILANAGGVTVSYFEWVQNRQGYYWTIAEVHERLKASMEAEGRAIWTLARERGISLRSAAYVHALGRLAEAIEAHGTQQFFAS